MNANTVCYADFVTNNQQFLECYVSAKKIMAFIQVKMHRVILTLFDYGFPCTSMHLHPFIVWSYSSLSWFWYSFGHLNCFSHARLILLCSFVV